jgi:ketosteroid isomerase-like protein
MQYRYLPLAAVVAFGLVACQRSFDSEQTRAEILELHRSFIEAHLAEDVSALVRTIPQDYLFVANGDVQALNGNDVQKTLQTYFDNTTFSHYEDTAEPIIGFSKDGTLAWAIFQVRVAGISHRETGTDHPFDTQWAWITLYEKRNGAWSTISDVSTNRPFTESQ